MAELFDQHLHNVTVHFEQAEEYPAGQGPLKTYIIEAHDLNGDSPSHAGTKAVLGIWSNGSASRRSPPTIRRL